MSWKCLKCGGDTAVFRTEKYNKGWGLRAIKRTHKCKSCGAEMQTREEVYTEEKAAAHIDKSRQATWGLGLKKLSDRCEAQAKEIARLKRALRSRPDVLAKDLTKLEKVAVAYERQANARHRAEDLSDLREIEQLVAVGY